MDKIMVINIEGEIFRGPPEKLVHSLKIAGNKAQRADENPHHFWQYEEHLRRSMKGRSISNSD